MGFRAGLTKKACALYRTISLLALFLWSLSMFLPVVTFDNRGIPTMLDGAHFLQNGWAGPIMLQFGWYANLLMIPAAYVSSRNSIKPRRLYFILAASLITLWGNTLFLSSIAGYTGTAPIVRWHAGYFLWMAATGSMGALLMWRAVRARVPPASK
ncbi:hypothetical protein DXH95_11300 [Sphingorhabdus pulchriflava]|uniref:Uncharacterized protein n=1 Tax=Sphingorhabdus pulchriflava TaxID=2292257 RepID=A0A371B4L9_9SPHN|nr:hypothetical protein [Sphingorhabdus pulchriflava]RDV02546.1 hypothetical protein DXH95_11300 [Sphingorhabdus pulchriflava]